VAEKVNVLIVSSNSEELMQLITILEDRYDIAVSSGGEDCIDAAIDASPDLIFVDDMLAGINCYEVCEMFKAESATKDVTVVLMSDLNSDELEKELNTIKADDYVCKPFVKSDLREKIETLLAFKYVL
jgi:PleD family two-component response regulator